MAARADIWLRYKDKKRGKVDSYYLGDLRLKTRDATEARARARLHKAGKWPLPEDKAAAVSVESFSLQPGVDGNGAAQATPAAQAVPPGSDPMPADAPPQTPAPAASEWTQAAAAASAEATPPITPEVVNTEAEQEAREATNGEIASMVVGFQLWGTEQIIKRRIWDNFVAPSVGADERAGLAAPYRAMLDYGGAKIKLPPWVTGLVFPAAIALMSAAAMSRAWAELARAQRAQAEAAAPVAAAA